MGKRTILNREYLDGKLALNSNQLLECLGYKSRQTLYRLRDRGELPLPSMIIGNQHYWTVSDVIRFYTVELPAIQKPILPIPQVAGFLTPKLLRG